MKANNTPFAMDADDVTMLAMARLHGTGKLNDKNVDCFVQGYKACIDALTNVNMIVHLLKYHHKELSKVRQNIEDYIGYADLRRGINEDEKKKIRRAEAVVKLLDPLIELIEKEEIK